MIENLLDRCTARSKRAKRRCKRPPTPGMRVCYYHGGKTPVGLGSPHYRHGKYSSVLPVRLQAGYQAARTDPELLSLRDEIAATDARLLELIPRLDTGESGQLWHDLQGAWARFTLARTAGDPDGMRTALGVLETVLTRGRGDAETWDEIARCMDQRRRLVEAEHKRLVAMQQVLTLERAAQLFALVTEVIKKHVHDRPTLAAISADLRVLSLGGDGAPARPLN